MTPAELTAAREHLHLGQDHLAAWLDVNVHTLKRWERGASPIPAGITRQLDELAQLTDTVLADLLTDLDHAGRTHLITYRTAAAMHREHPEHAAFPAAWHRAIAYHAARQRRDVTLIYADEEAPQDASTLEG